jgi:hypothetical protein
VKTEKVTPETGVAVVPEEEAKPAENQVTVVLETEAVPEVFQDLILFLQAEQQMMGRVPFQVELVKHTILRV